MLCKMFRSDAYLSSVVEDIDVSKIELTYQLRQDYFHTIPGLVDSIRKVGLLQPIVVRMNTGGHFEIVSGCRRYTACRSLGWKKIRCIIIEVTEKEAFEISLVENLQRTSLEPLEEARAFKKYVLDIGWGGITELAARIGRSHSYIVKHMTLLDLPPDVISLISNQQLNASTAQELFPIKNHSRKSEIARMIIDKKMSSKDARSLVMMAQSEQNELYAKHEDHDRYENLRKIERSMAQSILILRIAMNRIGAIIDEHEDNWLVHETLMEEKNVLHRQIDIVINKKKRLLKLMSNIIKS